MAWAPEAHRFRERETHQQITGSRARYPKGRNRPRAGGIQRREWPLQLGIRKAPRSRGQLSWAWNHELSGTCGGGEGMPWGRGGPREEGPLESRTVMGAEVGGWRRERMAIPGGAVRRSEGLPSATSWWTWSWDPYGGEFCLLNSLLCPQSQELGMAYSRC